LENDDFITLDNGEIVNKYKHQLAQEELDEADEAFPDWDIDPEDIPF